MSGHTHPLQFLTRAKTAPPASTAVHYPYKKTNIFAATRATAEGGGVAGTVYGGFLQAAEKDGVLDQLEAFAGTSAGSLTAFLMSIGVSADFVVDKLKNLDFISFKDDVWGFFRDIWRLRNRGGWHKGEKLSAWVAGVLEEVLTPREDEIKSVMGTTQFNSCFPHGFEPRRLTFKQLAAIRGAYQIKYAHAHLGHAINVDTLKTLFGSAYHDFFGQYLDMKGDDNQPYYPSVASKNHKLQGLPFAYQFAILDVLEDKLKAADAEAQGITAIWAHMQQHYQAQLPTIVTLLEDDSITARTLSLSHIRDYLKKVRAIENRYKDLYVCVGNASMGTLEVHCNLNKAFLDWEIATSVRASSSIPGFFSAVIKKQTVRLSKALLTKWERFKRWVSRTDTPDEVDMVEDVHRVDGGALCNDCQRVFDSVRFTTEGFWHLNPGIPDEKARTALQTSVWNHEVLALRTDTKAEMAAAQQAFIDPDAEPEAAPTLQSRLGSLWSAVKANLGLAMAAPNVSYRMSGNACRTTTLTRAVPIDENTDITNGIPTDVATKDISATSFEVSPFQVACMLKSGACGYAEAKALAEQYYHGRHALLESVDMGTQANLANLPPLVLLSPRDPAEGVEVNPEPPVQPTTRAHFPVQ